MAGRARWGRGLAALASLVACASGLAGCSGDTDEPAASPTPAASTPAAATADNGPDEPVAAREPRLPAAAEGESVRSAKAFVEYYIDLLNYASVTGDTKAFDNAAAPGCALCADYSNLFHSIWDDGGFLRSHGMLIQRLGATYQDREITSLALLVRAASSRLKQSASDDVSTAPAEQLSFVIDIRSSAMSWVVERFEVA